MQDRDPGPQYGDVEAFAMVFCRYFWRLIAPDTTSQGNLFGSCISVAIGQYGVAVRYSLPQMDRIFNLVTSGCCRFRLLKNF
jgi:hypothetical protein